MTKTDSYRVIIDTITGDMTTEPYTTEELAEQKMRKAKDAALEAETTTKAIARTALLERLGITEEEAQLLK
jgi:hypothetical protein